MHRLLAGAVALSIVSSTGLAQPCAAPRRTQWSQLIIPLTAPQGGGFGTYLPPHYPWVAAGDVDADGHDDIIIAATQCQYLDCFDSAGAGQPGERRPVVQVISGRTGELIRELVSPADPMIDGSVYSSAFGWTLAAADFDMDGHADVAVSSFLEAIDLDSDGVRERFVGAVRVYSGATGALMYTRRGDLPNSRFGGAMSSVGDWNGDGAPDLMVAESWGGENGDEVFVFSGRDGATISSAPASSVGLDKVQTISNIGDVSGDGQDDAALGFQEGFSGYKVVTSSAFGIVSTVEIANSYPRPPRIGDVDGDGDADLIGMVGVLFGDALRVHSGASGAAAQQFDAGYFAEGPFRSMVSVGDVNDDGVPDIAVGPAVLPDEDGPHWERLRVFSMIDGACLGSWETSLRASTDDGGPDTTLADAYSALVSGDFDGDGLLDVASVGVVENQYSPPYFLYQINIFRRPGCPEDMTGDGVIDFADLSALLDTFNDIASPGMLPADIDGNGQVDFGDLNLILALFNSGC